MPLTVYWQKYILAPRHFALHAPKPKQMDSAPLYPFRVEYCSNIMVPQSVKENRLIWCHGSSTIKNLPWSRHVVYQKIKWTAYINSYNSYLNTAWLANSVLVYVRFTHDIIANCPFYSGSGLNIAQRGQIRIEAWRVNDHPCLLGEDDVNPLHHVTL